MKFYIRRLGCPKNDVDADYIAARLIAEGHRPAEHPDDAEVVLVNTCGFIQAAKEESIEALLELAQLKSEGTVRNVIATGCLSQRYGNDLLNEMPELDGAFGHGMLEQIVAALKSGRRTPNLVSTDVRQLAWLDWKDRFISDAYPYSYVKLSDGCNRTCSFCSIPLMRGSFRSRPMDSIVREAEFLAANGKRELILVSQESTLWGSDLKEKSDIVQLLRRLEEVDGVDWIRLMYLYPSQVSDELIVHLASGGKTLDYFDLPLQHINDDILGAMHRTSNRRSIEALLDKIRRAAPDATLRTTFIVGFPGESEAQFEELLEFVIAQRFDRLGGFAFSPEEGTPAADMPDQVPDEVKEERLDRLMTLQQEVVFERNNSLIGNVEQVIIDEVLEDGDAVGRTRGDCPEIDQEVLVRRGEVSVGEIRPVRIEAAEGYDLIGSFIRESGS